MTRLLVRDNGNPTPPGATPASGIREGQESWSEGSHETAGRPWRGLLELPEAGSSGRSGVGRAHPRWGDLSREGRNRLASTMMIPDP